MVGTFLALAIAELTVPTLVPKPESPIVTQDNLARRKSGAPGALGLSQVTLDREFRSLKIRLSVVQPRRAHV